MQFDKDFYKFKNLVLSYKKTGKNYSTFVHIKLMARVKKSLI